MPRLGGTPKLPLQGKEALGDLFGVAAPPELLNCCMSRDTAVAIAAAAAVAKLVRRHGVVGFRCGSGLLASPADLVALAEALGVVGDLRGSTWVRPDGRSRDAVDSALTDDDDDGAVKESDVGVLRVVRESDARSGAAVFGEQWHRDGGWRPNPPCASLFAMHEAPASGGNTHFACAAALAATLPAGLAAALGSPAPSRDTP